MRFTRPWYGVLTRIAVLPLVLGLIAIEHAGEYAHDAVALLDEVLP